ncbi:MAG: hypothetical protein QHH06_00700 [Clostridiales bacterium]|jgi:hypothetical protein|nr:hypothetical protein [Eubacteriales bacterium]MDH7564989.1 hypothetical protein [Clostridiales bacterium]
MKKVIILLTILSSYIFQTACGNKEAALKQADENQPAKEAIINDDKSVEQSNEQHSESVSGNTTTVLAPYPIRKWMKQTGQGIQYKSIQKFFYHFQAAV